MTERGGLCLDSSKFKLLPLVRKVSLANALRLQGPAPNDGRATADSERDRRPSAAKLIVFARFPRLGKVKTRLTKDTSPEFSLGLYISMMLDTLERLKELNGRKYLFLEGCDIDQANRYLERYSLRDSFEVRIQSGGNLGERMWNACLETAEFGRESVFLGTDTPSLSLAVVEKAQEIVAGGTITLGPTTDGGYYLLGLPECAQELFFNIPWGTCRVLESTLENIRLTPYELLPVWYDIDTREDLDLLSRDLTSRFPGYPERTAAFLRNNGIL